MAKTNSVLTKLRDICLSLPETKETLTWGKPHFRVGDKIFAGCGEENGIPVIGFKLEMEADTMPVVEIREDKKYEKAVGMLLRMGGMFRTRPTHVLVVGNGQYRALVNAGLVSPNGRKTRCRGQAHPKKKV